MLHITFNSFDQLRYQVMSLFQLHIDIGKRILAIVAETYQPVVHRHEKKQQNNDDNNRNN